MSPNPRKSFTAVLERPETGLGWVIARVPFDVNKAWPVRNRLRVRGDIQGSSFRTSLFASPRQGGHFLLVNKKMLAGAGAALGDTVRICLEPDFADRPADAPPELARELKTERRLSRWFDALSPSMRREIGKWVAEPKSAGTRQKRAEKMAARLFLAMEGEADPPPVLRAAFERQPSAREGWEALTPAQRRSQLLAIFYYETPDGRARRAAKAVQEALQAVQKRSRRASISEEK